jgi:hypothetical protein
MADLVDLAIHANAQAAAEALGLKVDRSVTSGAQRSASGVARHLSSQCERTRDRGGARRPAISVLRRLSDNGVGAALIAVRSRGLWPDE